MLFLKRHLVDKSTSTHTLLYKWSNADLTSGDCFGKCNSGKHQQRHTGRSLTVHKLSPSRSTYADLNMNTTAEPRPFHLCHSCSVTLLIAHCCLSQVTFQLCFSAEPILKQKPKPGQSLHSLFTFFGSFGAEVITESHTKLHWMLTWTWISCF